MAKGLDPSEPKKKNPIFRDIRRYYCKHCGICRSKKALITSHIRTHHKDEVEDANIETNNKGSHPVRYTCEECGVSFRKPAYLKQHMQSHSIERPFVCSVNDCNASYRRKDHLIRHLLGHQGKLFTCPVENCRRQFVYKATMKRHVLEIHDDDDDPMSEDDRPKLYTCQEVGCGKVFKYPSKLRRHQKSHAKADYSEVACPEPGCMKYFANKNCLRAHTQACHLYIKCSICGSQQLKKNMKRHQRTHDKTVEVRKIGCHFEGCRHAFANKSNLTAHIKAVHLEERPFACRIAGCGKKFPFKHVRDKHENSGIHAYAPGDFLESDLLFRSRPRGGRKRKSDGVDSLLRRRVVPPEQECMLDNPTDYLRWLLADDDDEE